ncbi:tail fiber assembly protein [Enterobacter sp. 120016]|uniref:tail fiber assembly protein n=1 Tax=Enterobacter sp. 120016 TaxID=2834878 RepID=UPI001BD09AFF|nr:tail fiber assembly protein [Enterobacter sp. 120016]MBS7443220.1 tail fiber assembly protein [Enterobacter sp. 120016]
MAKAKLNNQIIATVAGDITVFNYDGETREYLSSSVEYLAEGVGIPGLSCIDAPGKSKEGFTIFRTSDLSAWEYLADHRSETVYSTKTGQRVTIFLPGDYPKDTTTEAPGTPYDKWSGSEWITDAKAKHSADVEKAEQQKTALLAEASAIIAPLADALAGGYIDDADIPRLTEWQRYRYKLTKVDIDTAPNLHLPPKPEV